MHLVVDVPSIGWSDFARQNSVKERGNSYTSLKEEDVIALVSENWDNRQAGMGEVDLSRKILVPVPSVLPEARFGFPANAPVFFGVTLLLQEGMPIKSQIVKRAGQDTEDLFIQNYISFEDSKHYELEPTNITSIVLYSKDALLENDGVRSTDCDWEIVAIITSSEENQPMLPLTMARNQLELDGGTASVYSSEDYAKAIAYWSKRVRVLPEKQQDRIEDIAVALDRSSTELLSLHEQKLRLATVFVDLCRRQGMSDEDILINAAQMVSESNFHVVVRLTYPELPIVVASKLADSLLEKARAGWQ